jgi:hypothetical protein
MDEKMTAPPDPFAPVFAILSNPDSYLPEAVAFARQHGRWPTGAEMREMPKTA